MAYEKENPQHDLHVVDWLWHGAISKRSVFVPVDLANEEWLVGSRAYDRGDLRTRTNWDLP